ncbi:MAG: serine/threonine protein phosphatase, partial [Spirochaetales bacterium]|nr:serine/threonine protein phosphatase [Spirochaetales bacterium]
MSRRTPLILLIFFFLPLALEALDFYWENPRVLVEEGVRFSRTVTTGDRTVVVWQESEILSEERGRTWISLAVTEDGVSWSRYPRVLGPFPFVGREIQFHSHTVDEDGRILLALSTDDYAVTLYSTQNPIEGFQELSKSEALTTRVTPRLFRRNGRGYILFITQEFEIARLSSLGIYYATSVRGNDLSSFKPLVEEEGLTGNFLPSYAYRGGREYVAFQVFQTGAVSSFQLYLKYTDNGGTSWSPAVHLSDFSEEWAGSLAGSEFFDNQRPFLLADEEGLHLTWERRYTGSTPQVYYSELDGSGEHRMKPERVTRGSRVCQNPRVFSLRGEPVLLWFDNRAGDNRIVLGYKEGLFWEEQDLTMLIPGNSTLPSPVLRDGDLSVVWENRTGSETGLLYLLPDKTVKTPVVRPVNFVPQGRAKQDTFTLRWSSPEDSSGIAGYSYSWDRRPDTTPPRRLMLLDRDRVASTSVTEDGTWYFHLAANDYAGNWSETVHVPFIRDTTPPGKVAFLPPETDTEGFLASNSETISWGKPEDTDLAGYAYRLQYLASAGYEGPVELSDFRRPPEEVMTDLPEYSFRNEDNGLWVLSVSAVDTVGNMGDPEHLILRMNKYIPVTFISRVNATEDELGRVELEIVGRGFSVGGLVSRVFLDQDGKEPFDYVFEGGMGLYTVRTDRIIAGPVIEDIDPGNYLVGVLHPRRGIHFSRESLTLESSGTVKFGDFGSVYRAVYVPSRRSTFSIPFNRVLLLVVMAFLSAMLVLSSLRMVQVVREGSRLKAQAVALLTGEVMEEKQKERIESMRKQGRGLRFKFALLVATLVLLVVLMVAIPLAVVTTGNQQRILAGSLEERVQVLLESLASGGRQNLRVQSLLEVSTLPGQMTAMNEATFVTITGEPAPDAEGDLEINDFVWASNNPEILEKTGGRVAVGGTMPLED